MTSAAQELQYQADHVMPLMPRGRSLAFITITLVCLVLCYILVGLRVWCRAIWLSNVWGLDDTLACIGLVAYTVASTYGILACTYGLGVPESQLDPALAYTTRGLEYFLWWEVSYLISAGIIKTSIGVAVIRIALERRYRYTIYGLLFLSNAACIGGVIWELAACRPIATRWNVYAGSCVVPGLVQISYAITAVTVITDAGYALVPIFILRRLSMVPRIKYGLMFVLALGSVAALAAVCRYPFLGYFGAQYNFLYDNVWIPLLSEIELAIGLITGSLPGIGKMFHFFDPPTKPSSRRGQEGWVANRSVGGSPLEEVVSVRERGLQHCVSENNHNNKHSHSGGRYSIPKLSVRSVKGAWQVKTAT